MNKQQNQVRPRMSRENYEWLKSIEGETNDERIENLRNELDCRASQINLLEQNYKSLNLVRRGLEEELLNERGSKSCLDIDAIRDKATVKTLNQCLDITGKEKIRMKSERDTFIAYLCVSMAVNFGLLGCIATLQGWF